MSDGQRDNERPWCDGVRSSAEAAKSELVSDASRVRAAAEEADRRLRPILNHREPRFGDLLRDLRERSGRTMGDVARFMAWDVVKVSDIERNKRGPPPLNEIATLAALLRIDAKAEGELMEAALRSEPKIATLKTDRGDTHIWCPRCPSIRQEFLGERLPCAGCSKFDGLVWPVLLPAPALGLSPIPVGSIRQVVFKRARWCNEDGTTEWRWRRA